MNSGILIGIFGSLIYDLIKESLNDSFRKEDADLINRVQTALEEASIQFFERFGDEFGEPCSSFLAREYNIDTIVKSMFYGNKNDLVKELSPKSFDGTKDVTIEALQFFVDILNEAMMKDFRLNKIIIEKNHISESHETSAKITNLIENLLNQGKVTDDKNNDSFKDWKITDEEGNEIDFIEGKQYIHKFSNGFEINVMFKNNLIYIEVLDIHGQKSYYESDMDGNVKDTIFPYALEEYKLIIPHDLIVHRNKINLANGFRREVIKLKWDKQADVVYNSDDQIAHINIRGGWEVKHKDKVISPKI